MTAFVGLTGGIAAGKSAVAGVFRERGVSVVDADLVAREVVERGSEGLAEIVDAFGSTVLTADGSLDRKKLGAIVFEEPELRRRLEGITHPRIGARSMQLMAGIAGRGERLALYEAALLVENGSYRMMQALVVVAAHQATQVARVMQRDGLDETGARLRVAAQLPLEEKIAVADFVIWNDGTREELAAKVREIHSALLARFPG